MRVDIRQRIARAVDRATAIAGVSIILFAAVLMAKTWLQLTLVIVGILLLEAATWRMASKLIPGGRRFHLLRLEVHHFMKLMRGLNEAARDGHYDMHTLRQDMKDSLDRMFKFAGREGDE